MCAPVGGQRAVDGRPLGLGDGVEGVAVAVANHDLHGQQGVVGRTVTWRRKQFSSRQTQSGGPTSSSASLQGFNATVVHVHIAARVCVRAYIPSHQCSSSTVLCNAA